MRYFTDLPDKLVARYVEEALNRRATPDAQVTVLPSVVIAMNGNGFRFTLETIEPDPETRAAS